MAQVFYVDITVTTTITIMIALFRLLYLHGYPRCWLSSRNRHRQVVSLAALHHSCNDPAAASICEPFSAVHGQDQEIESINFSLALVSLHVATSPPNSCLCPLSGYPHHAIGPLTNGRRMATYHVLHQLCAAYPSPNLPPPYLSSCQ
jgi:hypothetical protein